MNTIIVNNDDYSKSYNKNKFINYKDKDFKNIIKDDFLLEDDFNLTYHSNELKDDKLLSSYFLTQNNNITLVINTYGYDIKKIINYGLFGILVLLTFR